VQAVSEAATKIGRFHVPGHYTGDCRALLAELPDACVQTCVTSPPYWGLRDYGVDGQLGLESTPEEYIARMVDVFRGVHRVLRDDGTLWINIGDSYAGSQSGPQGKSGEMADRAVAEHRGMMSQTKGIDPKNPRKGAGSNDAPNRQAIDGLKHKDLVGIPWMLAFALRAAGWCLRSDIIWHKPNPMPESVTDRPTKAHEYLFLLSKSERYYYDADAIAELDSGSPAGNGFAGRQGGKRSTAVDGGSGTVERWQPGRGRNKRSVWTVATQPYDGAHFATFPPKLIEPCILAGARPGDVVLDPFFGSGTTGMVAETHGRRWLGFDLNPAYEVLQRARTAQRTLGGVT
jgi:DNA modification methylase